MHIIERAYTFKKPNSNVFSLVDNIAYPILWGLFGVSIVTLAFYIIAMAMDIQMSAKSMMFSAIMFVVTLFESSKIAAGFIAKGYVSECYTFIEENANQGVKEVPVSTAQTVTLRIHPTLQKLIDTVQVQDTSDTELYFDDLHATLNVNLWNSLEWLVGTILVCGIPALLLGQRRISQREGRRGQRSQTDRRRARMRR